MHNSPPENHLSEAAGERMIAARYNWRMQPFRFSLADLLFLSGAAPIWVWLIIKVPSATAWGDNPFRYMVPPFALFGMMIIFYLSLSPWRHAWSAAALLSSLCSTAGLFLLVAFAA